MDISRREFIKTSAKLGAGLILAFYLPTGIGAENKLATNTNVTPFKPNAFIRIGTDNSVTVICKHLEMGQGVFTGLPTLIAEELDADWSQIRVEGAAANVGLYKNLILLLQITAKSSSTANSYEQMRIAGATARAMLVTAAAGLWKVPEAEIIVSKGVLSHRNSGRKANFGELSTLAAQVPVPETAKLKDPKDFQYIGKTDKPLTRKDSPEKVNGSAIYTIDIKQPGMLTALVAHPPLFGATVKSLDSSKAKTIAGVVDVVQIPTGVAVLANGFWPAKKGRDALIIEWDTSVANTLGSTEIMNKYRALAKTSGAMVRNEGVAEKALLGATIRLSASFEFPYLAHAAMEPMNCAIALNEEGCELWNGEQFQTMTQVKVSSTLGLKINQIKINMLYAGGSFGRRASQHADYQTEAAYIIKAIARRVPVKLLWTREDDMRAGFYRPLNYHTLEAGLDDKGNLVAWHHRIVGQSILADTPLEKVLLQNGNDPFSFEGAEDMPYRSPNVMVDLHTPKIGVPVLWWRSVAHTHTAFSIETFMDELAEVAQKDPVEFRRSLIVDNPRLLNVLNIAAAKSNWGKPLPKGQGRGIALHKFINTYVAEVAEVTISRAGELKVDKVICVVDCGVAVNPKIIEAQMRGGIGFGLSAAMRGAITLKDGKVEQSNFHDYQPLRMSEMPPVEVHIVSSSEAPTGVGEPGVPPIAPAVCNAIYMANKKRIRSLPISQHDLSYV